MSTRDATLRNHGRVFGLIGLIALFASSADADAAERQKKSTQPPSGDTTEQSKRGPAAPRTDTAIPAAEPAGGLQRPASMGMGPMSRGQGTSGARGAQSDGLAPRGQGLQRVGPPATDGAQRSGGVQRPEGMDQRSGDPQRSGDLQRPEGMDQRSGDPQRAEGPQRSGDLQRPEGAGKPDGVVGPSQERGQAPGGLDGPDRENGGVSRPDAARTNGREPADGHARSTPDRGSSSSSASTDRSESSSHGRTPPSASSRGGSSHASASAHGSSRPSGTTRSYTSSSRARTPPAHASRDHRYGHPSPRHVRTHPHARHAPPAHVHYRAHYVNYWVHPYYRYQHAATVVVAFGFAVNPWVVTWAPPPRPGWTWTAGWYDAWGYYHPGYWVPVSPAPVYAGVSYVYVPGWWDGTIYVEGYYRPSVRRGWTWVDGYYLSDGSYVSGHWVPRSRAPQGYVWVPGFYDGQDWVEGFWRPEHRSGYTWVNGYFDENGIYNAGYWMPTQDRPGYVWVPGWFDGHQWVEGYWVTEAEYYGADVQGWEPEAGYDDGWQEVPQSPAPRSSKSAPAETRTLAAPEPASEAAPLVEESEDVPLAIPVEVQEEELR